MSALLYFYSKSSTFTICENVDKESYATHGSVNCYCLLLFGCKLTKNILDKYTRRNHSKFPNRKDILRAADPHEHELNEKITSDFPANINYSLYFGRSGAS